MRAAGIDVDNTDRALAIAKASSLTASELTDSDIQNIESLKERAMAPISEAPKKVKSRVMLASQANDEVGFIERDISDMEQAGIFREATSAKELIAIKEETARQELIQKKATEGRAGGKLTIEDMMHRPGK